MTYPYVKNNQKDVCKGSRFYREPLLFTVNLTFLGLTFFMICFLAGCNSQDSGNNVRTLNQTPLTADQVAVHLSWESGNGGGELPAGYYVYYGNQSGNLTDRIDVGLNNSVTLGGEEFGFSGKGVYYFQVVAYSTGKMFSVPSTEQAVNIQ